MITIERTSKEAMMLADGVIFTIKELHENNMPFYNHALQEARRTYCKMQESTAAIRILELSFGLAKLAVHAALLQEAAVNEKFAKQFWSNTNLC